MAFSIGVKKKTGQQQTPVFKSFVPPKVPPESVDISKFNSQVGTVFNTPQQDKSVSQFKMPQFTMPLQQTLIQQQEKGKDENKKEDSPFLPNKYLQMEQKDEVVDELLMTRQMTFGGDNQEEMNRQPTFGADTQDLLKQSNQNVFNASSNDQDKKQENEVTQNEKEQQQNQQKEEVKEVKREVKKEMMKYYNQNQDKSNQLEKDEIVKGIDMIREFVNQNQNYEYKKILNKGLSQKVQTIYEEQIGPNDYQKFSFSIMLFLDEIIKANWEQKVQIPDLGNVCGLQSPRIQNLTQLLPLIERV